MYKKRQLQEGPIPYYNIVHLKINQSLQSTIPTLMLRYFMELLLLNLSFHIIWYWWHIEQNLVPTKKKIEAGSDPSM